MPDDIHQSHDKLFKAGFSDPATTAAGFLRTQLPEAVAAAIDWPRLTLEPGSFVDSHFRNSESDLLFSAPLSGRTCLVYLLFEHQTTRDPLLALRLLRYMVRIWEARLKTDSASPLPVILPVVLAQNAEVWQMETQFSTLLDLPPDLGAALRPCIPDFAFRAFQLAATSFAAIRGTPAGILILRTMKAERIDRLLDNAVWDESLFVQIPRETFELLLRYILAADIDKTAFESKIDAIQNPQTRTNAMTLAEQYHHEGLEKGLARGLADGREEGAVSSRRQDVLEALEIRFGTVPAGLKEEIQGITSTEKLRQFLRLAIQCPTLEAFAAAL